MKRYWKRYQKAVEKPGEDRYAEATENMKITGFIR